jgi:hypothetical protein
MKKLAAVAVVAFSLVSVQSFAGSPVQIWKCGMDGDVAEEAIQEYAAKWEKGAAALPGGEGMSTDVLFPVAAAADGNGTDLVYLVEWASFADYGKWWDAYPDSDVAATEGEVLSCHGSALWEKM